LQGLFCLTKLGTEKKNLERKCFHMEKKTYMPNNITGNAGFDLFTLTELSRKQAIWQEKNRRKKRRPVFDVPGIHLFFKVCSEVDFES